MFSPDKKEICRAFAFAKQLPVSRWLHASEWLVDHSTETPDLNLGLKPGSAPVLCSGHDDGPEHLQGGTWEPGVITEQLIQGHGLVALGPAVAAGFPGPLAGQLQQGCQQMRGLNVGRPRSPPCRLGN